MKLKPSKPYSFFTLLVFLGLSKAFAANPCNGKADYEVRLDQQGKSLEGSEILDQDSVGVCYATSASTVLQSVIPGHPDISYLDYALQYKKQENRGKKRKIQKTNGQVFDSGVVCEHFDAIKRKGFCPRDKISLEVASATNPELQIQSFSNVGSFFELQKGSTPEQRKATMDAILKNLEVVREKSKEDCQKFPSEMRNLLQDIYAEIKKELDSEESSHGYEIRRREEALAEIDAKKKKKIEIDSKLVELKKKSEEIQLKKQSDLDRIDAKKSGLLGKVVPGVMDRKKNKIESQFDLEMDQIKRDSDSLEMDSRFHQLQIESYERTIIESEKALVKINKIRDRLNQIGREVPDTESSISGSTKLELRPELEKMLQEDYRNAMVRLKRNEFSYNQYSSIATKLLQKYGVNLESPFISILLLRSNEKLEKDYLQSTPDRCLSSHVQYHRAEYKEKMSKDLSCINPKLVDPAVSMLSVLGLQMNANMDVAGILDDMDSKTFDFMESLIGSTCKAEDRIKITGSMTCKNFDVYDYMIRQPERDPAHSEAVTARIADRFQKTARTNVDSGKAVLLGVCADMFDHVNADGAYGVDCNSGGHGVALIGYRCKAGKLNYLIQNSWGSDTPPYGAGAQSDHGRVWIPERLLIRNVWDYGVMEGTFK